MQDNGSWAKLLETAEHNFVMETSFTLHPLAQFDQAGLFIYVDDDHWIKAVYQFSGHTQLSG